MEREVGGGIGMGNTCKPMAVSFQCMTKSTTIKKIIIIFKKRYVNAYFCFSLIPCPPPMMASSIFCSTPCYLFTLKIILNGNIQIIPLNGCILFHLMAMASLL